MIAFGFICNSVISEVYLVVGRIREMRPAHAMKRGTSTCHRQVSPLNMCAKSVNILTKLQRHFEEQRLQ